MQTTDRSRRQFLRAIGLGAAGFAMAAPNRRFAQAAPAKPPNILLMMADDVGREALGCYGGESYETSNIDKLAAGGTRFTHAYCPPVCSPTRVKIMTGRYGFRTTQRWGHIPANERTFGHVLGEAGYATAAAGKWQMILLKKNPDHPQEMGFQESCLFGWHEGPRYHDPLVYETGEMKVLKGKYGPDVYCDFLIDFMERNKERPFLAYYPMALCHAISDDFKPPPPPGPDGEYQPYKELVATMDKNVGRLVAALERLGLRENTLVIFTTDNGSPSSFYTDIRPNGKYVRTPVRSKVNGKTVRGGKGSMGDGGTRVPLIANWPGVTPRGAVCDDLIDFSDFLPTLAELAGASVPEDRPIDGRSFAPQLAGNEGNPREWAYTQWRKKAWVRTRRWKLYRSGKLFDMANDPREKDPIPPEKASPEAKAAREKLQAVLDRLKKKA